MDDIPSANISAYFQAAATFLARGDISYLWREQLNSILLDVSNILCCSEQRGRAGGGELPGGAEQVGHGADRGADDQPALERGEEPPQAAPVPPRQAQHRLHGAAARPGAAAHQERGASRVELKLHFEQSRTITAILLDTAAIKFLKFIFIDLCQIV